MNTSMNTTDYSERFENALTYTTRLHSGQYRKSHGVPYVTHLLGVAALVGANGGTEDQVIGALLHDAVEDQPEGLSEDEDTTVRDEIREQFGSSVLDIVDQCTDSFDHDTEPWETRKNAYLEQLNKKSGDAPSVLVALADKLYNARTILRDLRRTGMEIFDRFNGGVDGTLWYYRALADAFLEKEMGYMAEELDRVVREMETRVDER